MEAYYNMSYYKNMSNKSICNYVVCLRIFSEYQ